MATEKEKTEQEAKATSGLEKKTASELSSISIKDYCNSRPLTDRDKFSYCKIFNAEGLKTSDEWALLIVQLA